MSHVIVTENGNGNHHAARSRYRSTCPACRKPIDIGNPIRPYSNNGKRTRWQHEDCDSVPEPEAPAGFSEAALQAAAKAAAKAAAAEKAVEITDAVHEVLGRMVATQTASLQGQLDELKKNRPQVVEVRHPDGKAVKIDGVTHPVFKQVVQLANARRHIFLPGPSGSGKSHLARQVAEALKLKFGHISCSAGMSESQLLGRMVPHGDHGQFEFLGTEFLDCYENGGVFLFDEIDAADSNVLLVVNSALANGHLSVPSRHGNPVAKRHENFICIAAANTWGRGADRQYVGRNELDESTIDRFRIGCTPMDYSEKLEKQLCPDDGLYSRLKGYRKQVQDNRLERIVSTRFIAEAYEMKTQWGWTDEQIDEQLFNGWRTDEVRKAKGGAA